MRHKTKLPRLTGAQRRATSRPSTEEDYIEDFKELYVFMTHCLLGAMVEPNRDCEQWVRRVIREALDTGTLRRINTILFLTGAQRKESAFQFMRRHWLAFESCQPVPNEATTGFSIVDIDLDSPVKSDF